MSDYHRNRRIKASSLRQETCNMNDINRCPWVKGDEYAIKYHDQRWCKPVHDDREHFALLVLESVSVGLSWDLILRKETLIRQNCDGLNPEICAKYGEEKELFLMRLPEMIHHRGKIRSIGHNARAFLKVQNDFGSFDSFIWRYTDGKIIDHRLTDIAQTPAKNDLSERISKDLKHYGFQYLGPVIIYSYMQSTGMVNDHLLSCPFR